MVIKIYQYIVIFYKTLTYYNLNCTFRTLVHWIDSEICTCHRIQSREFT